MFNFWKLLVFEGVEGIWVFVFIEDWMAWYFNSNYFWVGMLFCVFIIGLWYWCMDQYIVQCMLGFVSLMEVWWGFIVVVFFKLLLVFIFIILGIIIFVLAMSGKIDIIIEMMVDSNGELIIVNV